MRVFIILISLFSIFCSCKKVENRSINEFTQKVVESDTVLDGVRKTYFNNGKLKLVEEYQNGKQHGMIQGFFDNGNVKFIGSYYNGRKDGDFLLYYNMNKPLNQKIKIKEKWFEGKLIHNKYEYGEKMELENYYFHNLSGEIYYYEKYNDKKEIIERNGSKTPVIYSTNNSDNLKVGDSLQVIIFAPMSPFCEVKISARIKGYHEEWEPLEVNFRDNQIVYKKLLENTGDYRFEIKSMDSCDEKNYINALTFSVNSD